MTEEVEVVYRGFTQPGDPVITMETPGGEPVGLMPHIARHSPTGMSGICGVRTG